MKYFYYIRYFAYIAFNWNIRLAFFSIYHEVKGERKYNINTSRLNNLNKLSVKGNTRQQAEIYQGASYYLLENLFRQLQKLHVPDGLIDLGSGKGRVLVVAAHFGFTKITGVDFAAELCKEAEINCRVISKGFPQTSWKVKYANVVDLQYEASDHVFFFFNPFKEVVMTQVITNILQSLKKYPRKIYIVYINPQHNRLFIESGFREIYYVRKMQFVDGCIFEKDR